MNLPIHEHDSASQVIAFFDQTLPGLESRFTARGVPAYRARQLCEWVYSRGARSFDHMNSLPKSLRADLGDGLALYESEVVQRRDSADGTTKLLLRWRDGATSECVLIPDGVRRTACVSTQVGCPVRCAFCASGLDGLQRQLSAGEIIEQAMRISALSEEGPRLTNVVFMGLGEPLSNYDATVQALRTINAPWGLNIGARKMTVSTVGLPAQMRRLADERMQITLALSLHAPNDDLRRRIIPTAERFSIESLVGAAAYYFERTGREITIEYILLGGFNDTDACARELATLSRQMRCNVNLLLFNPVDGLPFVRPLPERVKGFADILGSCGVNVHVRRSRGLDVDAACGQLRRRSERGEANKADDGA